MKLGIPLNEDISYEYNLGQIYRKLENITNSFNDVGIIYDPDISRHPGTLKKFWDEYDKLDNIF